MKEKPRDLERLLHILEAAEHIKEFTTGLSYEDFLSKKVIQFAVVKNFEIIGEAAYHLTNEIKEASNEQIEWRKIMAFRHILVHDYWKIDYETVWNSKENKLDALIVEVTKLLERLG